MDKASKLLELLALKEPEEMCQYHLTRLIYPMGKLQKIDPERTIADQNIPDDAQLVLLGQKNFTWDINRKGPNVQVSAFCDSDLVEQRSTDCKQRARSEFPVGYCDYWLRQRAALLGDQTGRVRARERYLHRRLQTRPGR